MIVLSDNTATNMILDRFSADAVNAYLDRIGIKTTRSHAQGARRWQPAEVAAGWSAAGKLPENQKYGLGVSTPRDMVTILEKLERGAAGQRRGIAGDDRRAEALPRRLPGSAAGWAAVPVANKTGALDALRSDVGIVYAKGGRIAMAITVDGMPPAGYTPDNPGCLLIADLAKILVDGLVTEPRP